MNGKMKAGILSAPNSIALEQIDIPVTTEDGVLLKVTNCGICGTDLHFYTAGYSVQHPIGHEISGEVVEVGKSVAGFKEGDRVAVEISVYCGRCSYCLSGSYNLCNDYKWMGGPALPGGNAEYLSVPSYTLHLLPGSMSLEQGALLEPLTVAVHAVAPAAVSPGSSVAIFGSGTIGLTTLMVARAYGAARVYISAKYEHQALLAEKLGADCVIRLEKENLEEKIKSLTDGEGVDITFNTARSAEAFQDACKITRRKGKIVLLAQVASEPILLRFPLEATITSSFIYGSVGLKRDYEIAIDLVSSGKADVSSLVTHRFPLDDIQKAFQIALDKSTKSVKVMLCS